MIVGRSPALTADNKLVVSTYKPDAPSDPFCSHNFCDPCTWYSGSQRWTGDLERFDDSGTIRYRVPSGQAAYGKSLIDTTHGRLDALEDYLSSGYGIALSVDSVGKTEDTDFAVDYENGYFTFSSDPGESAVVSVALSYVDSSVFKFYAPDGYDWRIDNVELQFTTDTVIVSPIQFRTVVYLKDSETGEPTVPLDLGGGPVLATYTRRYKNKWHFVQEASSYYQIPGVNFSQYGGIIKDVEVHRWNYVGAKTLSSTKTITGLPGAYAIVLELYSEGDLPQQGTAAVLTLYTIAEKIIS